MPIRGAYNPFLNLLGEGSGADWKVYRYPFTDAAPEIIGVMKPGYLVKFNAGQTAVLPALAADDATLDGIIVDLPDTENPKTVAVAVHGTFDKNQIHYANAWSQGDTPTALSAACMERLRTLGIFLDPAVPAGPIAP